MEGPVWNQTLDRVLYFNEDSFTTYSILDNEVVEINAPERTDGR